MKTLISFDVDMTLLDHATYKIPDSAMEAIEALRKNHFIVLATGRDMDTYYSRQYRDQIQADAIIHSNGTKITVGDQVLYESVLPRELLERVLHFADEHDLAIGMTSGDDDYYIHPEHVTEHDIRRWGESGRQYKDPWKLLDMKVRTLAYIGVPEGAKLLEQEFPELKCPLFAGLEGADVIAKESSKANGLKILCEYFHIPVSETYAFGDSMNDLEILQEAGTGIAMGNAVPKLKEVADYVTDLIDENGIYNACKHFGLI